MHATSLHRYARLTAIVVVAAALGACRDGSVTGGDLAFNVAPGNGDATPNEFEVCKEGASAEFDIVRNPVTGEPTHMLLGPAECEVVAIVAPPAQLDVTVTEIATDPGFGLDSILKITTDATGALDTMRITGSTSVSGLIGGADQLGILAIFYNSPVTQGCTPGYWKNLKKHADDWTAYTPGQTVVSVFGAAAAYPNLASATLHEALSFEGGPAVSDMAAVLLRAAVAALLNAENPDVAYARDAADIIVDVDAALASGDRQTMEDLKDGLDADNNAGCPL